MLKSSTIAIGAKLLLSSALLFSCVSEKKSKKNICQVENVLSVEEIKSKVNKKLRRGSTIDEIEAHLNHLKKTEKMKIEHSFSEASGIYYAMISDLECKEFEVPDEYLKKVPGGKLYYYKALAIQFKMDDLKKVDSIEFKTTWDGL